MALTAECGKGPEGSGERKGHGDLVGGQGRLALRYPEMQHIPLKPQTRVSPGRRGVPKCQPSAQGTSKGGGAQMAGLGGWLFWIRPVKGVHVLKSFPGGCGEALAPDA